MKNFWDRREMWSWCFANWVALMKNTEKCDLSFEIDKYNFWLFLNNYNQLFGTDDQFAEDDAFDANVVVYCKGE